MNHSTNDSGAFAFADLLARTAGLSGSERMGAFHELRAAQQAAAWRLLREQVEERERVVAP
jgi:hypothetical protein